MAGESPNAEQLKKIAEDAKKDNKKSILHHGKGKKSK